MNKKRTLIWTLAAAATVAVVAQVQRADFSSMQKAADSHPEKQWAKEALPEKVSLQTAAADTEKAVMTEAVANSGMEIVEQISPALLVAEDAFDLSAVEKIAYKAPAFGESLFTASITDASAVKATKGVKPRVAGAVVTGTLISTDLNYQSQTYHYRLNLAASTAGDADPTAYILTGVYGTNTPLNVTIDAEAGKVTIPYQKVGTSGSDNVMICPMFFQGTSITYSKEDIEGTIDADGVITLPGWGLLITEGANAGRGYNFFTSSTIKPANVTFTAKNLGAEGAEITWGALAEQTADNTVTFIGLSGVTAEEISARINSKNQVMVPNSFVYTNQMYGDFYLYPCLENGKANVGFDLIGTGTAAGTEVTFPMWTIASRSLPSMYVGYLYSDIKAELTTAIKWPEPPVFTGQGDGSADAPYIINTTEDWQTIAAAVAEGESYANKYLKLGADIDLTSVSGAAYQPIGDVTTPFNGTFDGAGFTVKNLTVSSTSATYYGLFGYIGANGTVKNLKVDNVRINSEGSYIGIVSGWTEGTIDKVNVTSSLVIVNGEMGGGITGALRGGLINKSSFQGSVQGNGSVAGIAGQSHQGKITNCDVRANVTHRLYFAATAHDAAGIVGAASASEIEGCSSTGMIQDVDGYAAAGSLVARLIQGSKLSKSYTTMAIQATGNMTIGSTTGTQILPYEGGLCGYAQEAEISDCFSSAYIFQNYTAAAPYAGGLLGYLGVSYSFSSADGNKMNGCPKLTNCYFSGQVVSASTLAHKSIYGSTFIMASWTGEQPYEVAFENCYYDNEVALTSGDEWGRPTSFFTSALPAGFDANVWKSETGHYPVLKNYCSTQTADLASAAIILADGQDVTKVSKNFTVPATFNVQWKIAENGELVTSTDALSLSGSNATIGNNYANLLMVASSLDGWGIKYYNLSIVPNWFKGEGTEQNPFKLSSASDFEKLNTAVGTYGQGHIGDYFEVTNDIDFTGSKFEGIGAGSGYSFGGVLDGKGFSIENLNIDALVTNDSGVDTDNSRLLVGLVGILGPTGAVKNVIMDATSSFRGYGLMGAIAGQSYGLIENCRNYADITASHSYVGGIAGRCYNTTDALGNFWPSSKVINCYNGGTITAGVADVGGIAGYNTGDISLCQNDAPVEAKSITVDTQNSTSNAFGGIAGAHNYLTTAYAGTIDQCVNNGVVTAKYGVGGIAGYLNLTSVTNCVNNALITSTDEDIRRGGIIGQLNNRGTVENNFYDSSININGAANNAGITGVTGLSSTEMTSGKALGSLDNKVFDFAAEKYPVLAANKDEKATSSLRSIVVFFPDGMIRSNVNKPVALSTGTGWTLEESEDQAFQIYDNTLTVTMPEGNVIPAGVIKGVKGKYSKVLSMTAIPTILKGEGSEGSPFLIETPEDWNKLADFMTDTRYEYPSTYFRLVNDLDFQNDSIKLLAVNGVKFCGVFDGNGKTVSNFVYNNFNTSTVATSWKGPNLYRSANIGLFGTLGAEGTIKNLTSNGELHIYTQAGGIVGEVYGTVDNCHHKGTVSTFITQANGNTGGSSLVGGIAYKLFDGGKILNCSNSGNVISKSTYPAGIVCRTVDNTLVENCVNTGTVTATTNSVSGVVYECGGVVRNSGNKGKLEATASAFGVCYTLLKTGKLEGCYNEADINLGETGATISGIVNNTTAWVATAGQPIEHTSWIKDCYNTGNLTGKNAITGIAGNIKSGILVENCYNTGDISAIGTYGAWGITQAITGNGLKEDQPLTEIYNTWNSGKITSNPGASSAVAGFAKTTSKGLIMDNCYNLGDVTLIGRTTASGQICVAVGLINQISGGIFTNCWNAGNVYGMSPCNGGLGGYIAGTDLTELYNCFNLGDIEGSNVYDNKGTLTDGNTNGTAGGLFGYISTGSPKIINCYNAGNVKGNNRVGGITGGMFNATAVLENVYNVGKVECENNWWSATCYHNKGETPEDREAFFENSKNVYYDVTINPGTQYTNFPGSAKTTEELCALEIEGYVNGYGYPYLASFQNEGVGADALGIAGLSTALPIPAEGDTADKVTNFVTLASTPAVTWTAEPVGEDGGNFVIEGNLARPDKVGKVKLIASALDGKFTHEFELVIDSRVSGVDNAMEAKEVKSTLIVDMQGRIIREPQPGQPYVVRINYTDGTSETRRVLNK